jgi:drug/metabolite transporter (DMT)-like permease
MRITSGPAAATACGLAAILLWSTASGLIRSVSEYFGPIGGAALIYTFGAALLVLLLGRPRLRHASRFYLISGSALFVAYEVCLSLALGFAVSRTQAIQLVVVNSLWPSLTVRTGSAAKRCRPSRCVTAWSCWRLRWAWPAATPCGTSASCAAT